MGIARNVSSTVSVVVLCLAGLVAAASPATADFGDGSMQIVVPGDEATVENVPFDLRLSLTPDLDTGTYYVSSAYAPLARPVVQTIMFEVTAADLATGHDTVYASGLFNYGAGRYELSVGRDDPAGLAGTRILDEVMVTVVEPTEPSVEITPADGSAEPTGSPLRVTVRLTDAPAGRYLLRVRSAGTDGYDVRRVIDHDGTDRTYGWNLPAPTVPRQHVITVESPLLPGGQSRSVIDVYQAVDVVPVSHRYRPATFYPLVRDRYRDTTNIAYRLNIAVAEATVHVLDARGRSVRAKDFGHEARGYRNWTWDGRNDVGELVPPGRYTLQVFVQGAGGTSDTLERTVTVATKIVKRWGQRVQKGTWTSSRSKAGTCYFNGYAGSLRLDCWSGSYAQATWTFRVPTSATALRVSFRDEVGCCDEGQIIRTGGLVRPGIYKAMVRVTNWRSLTVESTRVTFRYDKRI